MDGETISIDIEDLKVGDIIEFERADGLYFHCGIYDGKGGVIHRAPDPGTGTNRAHVTNSLFAMVGKESNKAVIRRDDLISVAKSSDVYRTNMYDRVRRPRGGLQSLEWAEERIGQEGYSVWNKNCQHFCTEARYGTPLNMQGEAMFGSETEFSYMHDRVLVVIVNRPDSSLQPVCDKSAVKKVEIGRIVETAIFSFFLISAISYFRSDT